MMKYERYNAIGKTGQLCWDCVNATKPHICSWAKDYTPVKGWDAVPDRLKISTHYIQTYLIYDCPLFVRDKPPVPVSEIQKEREKLRAGKGRETYNLPERTESLFVLDVLERLKDYIQDSDITPAAKELGFKPDTVRAWVIGRSIPHPNNAVKLNDKLKERGY